MMQELTWTLLQANRSSIKSLMQPNAGMPKIDADNQVYYDMPPDEYAAIMGQIHAAGINILGGCCGTTPEYLRQVKSAISRK